MKKRVWTLGVMVALSAEPVATSEQEKTLQVPEGWNWYVRPLGPVNMADFRKEIQAKRIPGLMPRAVNDESRTERAARRKSILRSRDSQRGSAGPREIVR